MEQTRKNTAKLDMSITDLLLQIPTLVNEIGMSTMSDVNSSKN